MLLNAPTDHYVSFSEEYRQLYEERVAKQFALEEMEDGNEESGIPTAYGAVSSRLELGREI